MARAWTETLPLRILRVCRMFLRVLRLSLHIRLASCGLPQNPLPPGHSLTPPFHPLKRSSDPVCVGVCYPLECFINPYTYTAIQINALVERSRPYNNIISPVQLALAFYSSKPIRILPFPPLLSRYQYRIINSAAMANLEPQRPPSRWPAPAIHVHIEFGVSFTPNDPPHTRSMKYTSNNMNERIERQRREELTRGGQESLSQGSYRGQQHNHQLQLQQSQRDFHHQQQQRHSSYNQQNTRSLTVSTRGARERGSSAPPFLPPISPVSPMSSYRNSVTWNESPYRNNIQPESRERPLPPVPSRFRLGEDDLPWSTPAWYRSPDVENFNAPSSSVDSSMPLSPRRSEDPRRVRELEDLHLAMMTVDSLGNDDWETWTWGEGIGEIPRGPRSLGWAVSSTEEVPDLYAAERQATTPQPPPPPPYVVSQWERTTFERHDTRPRSAYA